MRARNGPQVGEVMFFCGRGGGVHVTDEHDVFADEYEYKMRLEWHATHDEGATLEQSVEWRQRARNASLRSLTVEESNALDAARELLEARGYVVTDSLAGASVLAVDPAKRSGADSWSTPEAET